MYELVRLSLMNWNLIELEDIEIDGTTALIGKVGVGKSTLLDAMQTLLSGNQRSRLQLNRAAGQKASKRSVQEYCLGVTEETQFLDCVRPACHSMIAMTFRERRLAHAVSIGIVLYAERDKPQEDTLMRWIAPGVEFSFERFADRDGEGQMMVASCEDVVARVRAQSGKAFQTHNAVAGHFVDNYLRAMRPKGQAPDSKRFLKRFRNAIAFEDIAEPTEFIRNFILEEDPIDIEGLRQSLEAWDEMEAKVAAVEAMLREARDVQARHLRMAEARMKKMTHAFEETWFEARLAMREAEIRGEALDEVGRRIAQLENERIGAERKIAQLQESRERKKDAIRASGASARAITLEATIRSAEKDAERAEKDVIEMLRVFGALARTERLDSFLPARVKEARMAADRIEAARRALASGDPLPCEDAELRALIEDVGKTAVMAERLDEVAADQSAKLQELKDEQQRLQRTVRLRHGQGAILDDQVQKFLNALTGNGVMGHALPSLVEVVECRDAWVAAAEAVLGPYRQAIFVPPETFDEAFSVLADRRQEYFDIRLVDTKRLSDPRRARAAVAGSIMEVLETEDPLVRRFLDAHAGHILRAETDADLKAADHAITRQCVQKLPLAVRTHRPVPRMLGRAAQAELARTAMRRLEEVGEEMRTIEARLASIRTGRSLFEAIGAFEAVRIDTLLGELRASREALAELRAERAAQADPETRKLEEEIAGIEHAVRKLQNDIDERVRGETRQALGRQGALKQEKASFEAAAATKLEALAALREQDRSEPFISFRKAFRDIEQSGRANSIEATEAWLARSAPKEVEMLRTRCQEARERLLEVSAELPGIEGRARTSLHRLLDAHHDLERVAGREPEEILLWLVDLVFRLEEHELRAFKAQIEAFRTETRREVKEILVMKLHDQLQRAQSELRKLNKRLRRHRFEGLTYVFDWKVNPAMRPLYQMTRRVAEEPDRATALLDDGGDPMLDEAVEIIRDIFADARSTERFGDYRQYFDYELRMTVEDVSEEDIDGQGPEGLGSGIRFSANLSDRVGKGSGGQKQTPYYVAIAASMAAAYYPGAREADLPGMGLVCFDEAFSKLDIANTQELIRFFQDLGLQIVVAAPEEKRTSFMELMDTIVNISKIPGVPELYIDVERIGPRAREELRAANPERLGLEGYRAQLAEDGPDEPGLGVKAAE